MAPEKLCAWWFARQGLGGQETRSPADVLEKYGWARSVGGVNPYLTLIARGCRDREAIDSALANEEIQELPSARGCTYVLPRAHYALGLQVGNFIVGEGQDLKTARKFLGVTDDELGGLEDAVLLALSEGPLDPKEIKAKIGDASRSLGDEGKKRGVTTTLPLALGALQAQGRIRRVPVGGRLDGQRFRYAIWNPSPLGGSPLDETAAFKALAELYFRWIGAASVKQFQWFSGLSLGRAKLAVDSLELVPFEEGSDLLMLPHDRELLETFSVPSEQQVVLLGSIDPLFHLRRDISMHLSEADSVQDMFGEKGLHRIGTVQDLTHHAIVDRGRIIGLWEYDPNANEIAWKTFASPTPAVREAVGKMEEFVREQLGDARSFSLDSPESRRPRLEFLRSL